MLMMFQRLSLLCGGPAKQGHGGAGVKQQGGGGGIPLLLNENTLVCTLSLPQTSLFEIDGRGVGGGRGNRLAQVQTSAGSASSSLVSRPQGGVDIVDAYGQSTALQQRGSAGGGSDMQATIAGQRSSPGGGAQRGDETLLLQGSGSLQAENTILDTAQSQLNGLILDILRHLLASFCLISDAHPSTAHQQQQLQQRRGGGEVDLPPPVLLFGPSLSDTGGGGELRAGEEGRLDTHASLAGLVRVLMFFHRRLTPDIQGLVADAHRLANMDSLPFVQLRAIAGPAVAYSNDAQLRALAASKLSQQLEATVTAIYASLYIIETGLLLLFHHLATYASNQKGGSSFVQECVLLRPLLEKMQDSETLLLQAACSSSSGSGSGSSGINSSSSSAAGGGMSDENGDGGNNILSSFLLAGGGFSSSFSSLATASGPGAQVYSCCPFFPPCCSFFLFFFSRSPTSATDCVCLWV